MLQLEVHQLFLIDGLAVVLLGDTTEEDKELDEFHLVRSGLILDRVDDGAHRLSVDSTNHHFRHIESQLAYEALALRHHDVALLCVCK